MDEWLSCDGHDVDNNVEDCECDNDDVEDDDGGYLHLVVRQLRKREWGMTYKAVTLREYGVFAIM
jgi:hypothetical protein